MDDSQKPTDGSQPPQPPGAPQPPVPPGIVPRKYSFRCWLENNTVIDVHLEGLDHIGALAKMAAVASELVLQQPFRMLKIEMVDTTGQTLILPSGRMPPVKTFPRG